METSNQPTELKDLKVGDEVIIFRLHYPVEVAKIERITKTGLIRVNGVLYYNISGKERSTNFYSDRRSIAVPTAKLREGVLRRALLDGLTGVNFSRFTTDQLTRITLIMEEKQE